MVFDRAPRDLNIIERDGVISELLITFVPFACDQHNVARLRQRNGAANRRHSIDNFFVMSRATTFFDFSDNGARIFFARIIRGDNRIISMPIHYFAHQWTLLAVTIAAASENDNQPMRFEFTQSFKNIPKGVRCVCVIDENLELSLRWNYFQTSRDLRRSTEAEDCLA